MELIIITQKGYTADGRVGSLLPSFFSELGGKYRYIFVQHDDPFIVCEKLVQAHP